MIISNIFLALPVIYAGIYKEYIYLFFASGIFIFSPLFHWYRINKIGSFYYRLFRICDWVFAIGAFIYMYYYVFKYTIGSQKYILFILLSTVIMFFWYGFKLADYKKLHPWFHIIAPLISILILFVAHHQ